MTDKNPLGTDEQMAQLMQESAQAIVKSDEDQEVESIRQELGLPADYDTFVRGHLVGRAQLNPQMGKDFGSRATNPEAWQTHRRQSVHELQQLTRAIPRVQKTTQPDWHGKPVTDQDYMRMDERERARYREYAADMDRGGVTAPGIKSQAPSRAGDRSAAELAKMTDQEFAAYKRSL